MNDEIKVALLANVLRAFGLPPQAIDELVTTVVDLTAEAESAVEPFCLRQHFLSAAEHRFYLVLREAAQGWAQVYPKVGLGSLFFARCGGYSQFLADTHRINHNHVDFLLCRPDSLLPALGIMLDAPPRRAETRSAGSRRAETRNAASFVDEVFAAARLPLIHLATQRAYNVQELAACLSHAANLSRLDAGARAGQGAPCCPQCGSEMALGVGRDGALQWTCVNFPCCRAVQRHESQPHAVHA